MSPRKILYEVKDLPVFQNRVFDTQKEAKNIARGDQTIYVMNPNYVEECRKYVSSISSKHSLKFTTL
jgi:hypothetical protein